MASLMELLMGGQQPPPPQTDKFGIEIVPGLMGQGAPPPGGLPQHYGELLGQPPAMDPNQMQILMQLLMGAQGRGR